LRLAALSAPSLAPLTAAAPSVRTRRALATAIVTAAAPAAPMLAKADASVKGAEQASSVELAFADAPGPPQVPAMLSARVGETATPAIFFRVNGDVVAFRISAASAQTTAAAPEVAARISVRLAHRTRTSRLPAGMKLQIVEQGD
jgi:hypothetical protein